ncbi:MAG: glutaredoxin domain-containing protein [Rubrivivax sp.]|jgi:glutaredoxin
MSTAIPRRTPVSTAQRTGLGLAVALAIALGMALCAGGALAQYKVVGPDGSVTYTDRPPTGATQVRPLQRSATAPAAPELGDPALPPLLRQLALRYPVTLYTTPDCPACDEGRTLLTQRGIPYRERRITTEDDVQALERALGWRTVPSLNVGSQGLRGFTAMEWTSYLDLAGYPRESRLPATWKPPAVQPLAGTRAAAAEPARTEPATATVPNPAERRAPAAEPAAEAPGRIRF